MAEEPDECIKHVMLGASYENEAIELDRAGKIAEALEKYDACERELSASIAAALPDHAADKPKLETHRSEILQRIAHLKSLKPGELPSISVESQINQVQLGMQAAQAAQAASRGVAAAGGVKVVAATAAVGAAAGFLVLGSAVGTTIAVVGGASAAAYATSRSDKIGDVARGVGQVTLAGVDKAKAIDQEHNLSGKAATAVTAGVTKAKEVNNRFGITDKVAAGVGTVVGKVKSIEEKHHVTDKVASGIGAGLTRASAMLGSSAAPSGAAAAAAPAADPNSRRSSGSDAAGGR